MITARIDAITGIDPKMRHYGANTPNPVMNAPQAGV